MTPSPGTEIPHADPIPADRLCLWFDDQAEEAVDFCLSVFDNARIVTTARYSGESALAAEGPTLAPLQAWRRTAVGCRFVHIAADAKGLDWA